jgi:hypothetical protein
MCLVQLTSSRGVARAVAFSAASGRARKIGAYGVMVIATTRAFKKCTKKYRKRWRASRGPRAATAAKGGGAARGRESYPS